MFHSVIYEFIDDLKEKKKIEVMKLHKVGSFNFDSSSSINQTQSNAGGKS